MGGRTTIWTLASLVWMGVIFGLSSLPPSAVPGRFGSIGHFGLYAVLATLYFGALPAEWSAWRRAGLAVALASAYGISDEFHQSFVPGRMPDPVDWLVDTGGALAAAFSLAFRHVLTGRERPPA